LFLGDGSADGEADGRSFPKFLNEDGFAVRADGGGAVLNGVLLGKEFAAFRALHFAGRWGNRGRARAGGDDGRQAAGWGGRAAGTRGSQRLPSGHPFAPDQGFGADRASGDE
jgi:hypothetical protein